MIHKRVNELDGVRVLESYKVSDSRGTFTKFRPKDFAYNDFDSIALSVNPNAGTIRGMHFQLAPFTEEKIVSCIQGSIFDAAVDLRPESSTFGFWMGIELNPENTLQLFLPKGIAHGFQVLVPNTITHYVISGPYSAEDSLSINPFFDSVISWPLDSYKLSERDRNGTTFKIASDKYQESIEEFK